MVHLSPSQIVNRKACAVAASEESAMSAREQSILAGMGILVFEWVFFSGEVVDRTMEKPRAWRRGFCLLEGDCVWLSTGSGPQSYGAT